MSSSRVGTKRKKSKFAKWSLLLSVIVMISSVVLTIINGQRQSIIILNTLLGINIMGLCFSVVSILRKEPNKRLVITGIIFNAVYPIGALLGIVSALIRR